MSGNGRIEIEMEEVMANIVRCSVVDVEMFCIDFNCDLSSAAGFS